MNTLLLVTLIWTTGSRLVSVVERLMAAIAMFRLTPDEINWVQVIGAVGSTLGSLGVPVALWAIRTAKRDLARERRITHDLEVLRGLADVPAYGYFTKFDKIRTYLLLISDSNDMPMTRAALLANASAAATAEYRRTFSNAPRPPDLSGRLALIGWDTFHEELLESIKRRVCGQL